MVATTQMTDTEILALIVVLIFNFLTRKVLLNRKDNRNS